ncbi:MAG TPA: hypothetical protein VFM29_09170 [Vicinamibacteria bacterium]|nr:hypothetical protein [Vicinamibacteria bacterium]
MDGRRRFGLGIVAATLVAVSCGGDAAPRPEAPSAVAVPEAGSGRLSALDEGTPASPSPAPAWTPVGTYTCPLGKGDVNAVCGAGSAQPVFLAQVQAAVDEVVRTRPELVDTNRVFQGGYLVVEVEKFYLAVAGVLQAQGLCAGWDLAELQVKDNQGFSEQYQLLHPNDHLRRDASAFRATCTPSSFPLDAGDRIHWVRVGFYSITCEDGRTPPRNGERQLPEECTGWVTASPKDANDHDIDRRIHGPYITWELRQDGEHVTMEDFPDVPFNKWLRGRVVGPFELCATVQGKTGCLYGTVTAKE